jgi:hypothetical protein
MLALLKNKNTTGKITGNITGLTATVTFQGKHLHLVIHQGKAILQRLVLC